MFQRLKTPQLPQTRTAICDIITSLAVIELELEHQIGYLLESWRPLAPAIEETRQRKSSSSLNNFTSLILKQETWLLSSFGSLVIRDFMSRTTRIM